MSKSFFLKILIGALVGLSILSESIAQIVPSIHLKNKSFTYSETIDLYQKLTHQYSNCNLTEYGLTDCGKPLHLFSIQTKEGAENDKVKILILNGIHPGEPDGINASLFLSEKILKSPQVNQILSKVSIFIIPTYNIDGMLNRGCCSRANQNGPEEYGFRGNAKNLDLNRDFIKNDTRNSQSFTQIFQSVLPDVFVDTHVSNGADYQYTMTLIASQYDKVMPPARDYFKNTMVKDLFQLMKLKDIEMAPYVNTFNHLPDSGIYAFYESPRFSTGYSTLFGALSFVTETHMLKPFDKRVDQTLGFLSVLVDYCINNQKSIKSIVNETRQRIAKMDTFPIHHSLDKTKFDWINFKGYEAGFKLSEVTHSDRLFFNHNKPFTKPIKYYQHYSVTESAVKPLYYIIPQAWDKVIQLLMIHQVEMTRLPSDSTIHGKVYRFSHVKSTSSPYEGHYYHSNFEMKSSIETMQFFKGDYVIQTGTLHDYFLASVLEPKAVDSYFRWGFFDSILQNKEGFSDYVFYDTAAELLKQNPELKQKFEDVKKSDETFKNNSDAQLQFIYQNSPFYERSSNRYPVMQIVK